MKIIKRLCICIYILFTMFSSIFIYNIKAKTNNDDEVSKPLIILTGYDNTKDYSEILSYDGYAIVSSNINFEKEGKYQIEYLNIETKKNIIKEITIKNNIDDGYTYYQPNKKEYIIASSNKEIEHIVEVDDNKICYLEKISYEMNDIIYNDYYITYKINDKVKWRNKYSSQLDGEIVDFIYHNGCFIGIGNIYTNSYNIFLFGYNTEGKRVFEKSYGGRENDYARKIIAIDSKLYIAGVTSSSDNIFKGVRQKEDSFLMIVDNETMEISTYVNLSLPYNDDVIDITTDEQYLYIAQQYIDTVQFTHQINKIIKLSLDVFFNSFATHLSNLKLTHYFVVESHSFVSLKR